MLLYPYKGGKTYEWALKTITFRFKYHLRGIWEKVGITRSAVGRLEKGERNLTKQMIISICREFKVNESWFRTGEGSMFLELPEENETAALVASMLDSNKDAFMISLSKSWRVTKH